MAANIRIVSEALHRGLVPTLAGTAVAARFYELIDSNAAQNFRIIFASGGHSQNLLGEARH